MNIKPVRFFVADTHFDHKNIMFYEPGRISHLGLSNHPVIRDMVRKRMWKPDLTPADVENWHEAVEAMNQALVDNWNAVVRPTDKVYHLGDVCFRNHQGGFFSADRLNGKKRLILGNHDKASLLEMLGWEIRGIAQALNVGPYKCLLTHMPVHEATLDRSGFDLNIHGHFHSRILGSHRHVCVSVETIGYFPISEEALANFILH